MLVIELNNGTVQVSINRTVAVGQRLRISPSQGYAGIIEGYIEVTHVLSSSDITNIAGDDDASDLISMIESYKETSLDMHTDREGVPYEPEYSEELTRMDSTVWVAYKYPHNQDAGDTLWVFPIEEFLAHTSLF